MWLNVLELHLVGFEQHLLLFARIFLDNRVVESWDGCQKHPTALE